MTSIDFKDVYFHIPIQEQSRKYLGIHLQGGSYLFKALPFGLSKDPSVPSRLVGESQIPPRLSPAYSGTSKNLSQSRLASEFGEIRAGPQASL